MQGGRSRCGRPEGLTKTQQLRQARTAALVKEYEKKSEPARPTEPVSRRKVRSTYEPKKVDFTKPSMTKTMLARVKHAEKFKQEYERKTIGPGRVPKRTSAPIAGDARLGRERATSRQRSRSPSTSPRRGNMTRRSREPSFMKRSPSPGQRYEPLSAISEKAAELAKSMTADIIDVEPVHNGPIDSIVIPPGLIDENRTTIVTIPQPTSGSGVEFLNTSMPSQVANRSIQVISETLDEQDAVESEAVNQRLTELQQARRDFVFSVANVGGNAIHIPEGHVHGIALTMPPTGMPANSYQSPPRRIYKIPSLEDDMFKVQYGRDHPDVVAAREFAKKSMAGLREREQAQRMEQEFERIAHESTIDDLHLSVPFEEEFYQDPDISWELDESGMPFPRPSKVKATIPPIPKRSESYHYDPFDPDELERFFDVQRYPEPMGESTTIGPPTGRAGLHPDLWDLEDPWYRPPPEPDIDLIDFRDDCYN